MLSLFDVPRPLSGLGVASEFFWLTTMQEASETIDRSGATGIKERSPCEDVDAHSNELGTSAAQSDAKRSTAGDVTRPFCAVCCNNGDTVLAMDATPAFGADRAARR